MVQLGIEPFIMGTERIQNLPDDAIAFVVVQRLFRGHASRNANRQDDITHVLARCPTHDAPHRLHNINLALAGMHEQDGIQGRNVHAFGKATGVRQNAANVVAMGFFQPFEMQAAFLGSHRAVNVVQFAFQRLDIAQRLPTFIGGQIFTDNSGELAADQLGRSDILAERQGPLHRLRIG